MAILSENGILEQMHKYYTIYEPFHWKSDFFTQYF